MIKEDNCVNRLQVNMLHKSYAARKVLTNINLTLEAGSITALVGPNGAGKSTLLNVLSGRSLGDSGYCMIERRNAMAPLTKWDTVLLPQSYTLPDYLKVKEVFLHLKNISPFPEYYERCFNTLHLQPISDLFINQLSTGQRQKVYLGLVLASHTNILLLDEPTSAMDIESREQAWNLVRWRAENNCIVIFSSHSDEEIQSLANRFVFINNGEIVKTIAVKDLSPLIKEGYCIQAKIGRGELENVNDKYFNQSTYCEQSFKLNTIVSPPCLADAINEITNSGMKSRIISIENSLIKNARFFYVKEIV